MLETLNSYDDSLMLYLNYDGGTWTDMFWYTFSGKFIWIGVYLVVLIKLFLAAKANEAKVVKTFLWLVLCTALVIVLADQISSGIIKPLVERPRPSHDPDIQDMLHYVNGYRGGAYGFVSSHAANSIGFALWLTLLFRSWIFRSTIILWSILTCYSRIYLGVHYVGDIIGGLCVGIVCALLVHYCYRRFVHPSQQISVETKEPWLIIIAIFATVILIGLSYFLLSFE